MPKGKKSPDVKSGSRPKRRDKKMNGIVGSYTEQGMGGVSLWIFDEDGKKGWKTFNVLEAGDHLTIYKADNSVAFKGKIKPDYKTGSQKSQYNDERFILALNIAVSWVQKGWKPDDWARLFSRSPSLRAILKKKEKKCQKAKKN